jgi:hypothetical protein
MGTGLTTLLALTMVVAPLVVAWLLIARAVRPHGPAPITAFDEAAIADAGKAPPPHRQADWA